MLNFSDLLPHVTDVTNRARPPVEMQVGMQLQQSNSTEKEYNIFWL